MNTLINDQTNISDPKVELQKLKMKAGQQTGNGFRETKVFRIGMLFALTGLLAACGSDSAPRVSGPDAGSAIIDTNGTGLAECSFFDATGGAGHLGGKITTYYYNGALQEDKVRIRLTSLDAAFDSDASYYIQVYRWRVNDGTADLDSTPLQFRFELGTGSATPISNSMTSVNGATIAQIRSSAQISGTTALDFFSQTTMVISGVDYGWQALKIVLYDGVDGGGTPIAEANLLMPIFEANPNSYAATHDPLLASIHPFWSQKSTTASETEWSARSQSFCF